MNKPEKTWKDLIHGIIDELPTIFTLSSVLAYKDLLMKEYPLNRFIDAKIRQTLQLLRDQGVIEFLGGGKYRRLDQAPSISLLVDVGLKTGFSSKSQMARVMIETWAELNLYCLNCTCDRLRRLPVNAPLADFDCPSCNREYQLKAKDGAAPLK